MGNTHSSKKNSPKGGRTVLGPGPGQTTGSSPSPSGPGSPQAAAAEAAERRMKAAQARGTAATNSARGELSAKLEASKTAKPTAEARPEERLVWD